MRRSSLKSKKPLARKTPLRAKTSLKATKRTLGTKNAGKVAKITKKLPKWLKAIPESQGHGAGTYQKRLWRVTSDIVRIRDWHKYGVCAATGTRIETWQQGQAGHLKPYTNCNCLFKFDLRNIHLQSANSNKWGNYDTFKDFEKVVRNRGYEFGKFVRENNKANGCRLYDSEVIEEIGKRLEMMKDLPEQPSYFERAYRLYKESV